MRSGIPRAAHPNCFSQSGVSEQHQKPTVATGNTMTVTFLFRKLIRKPTGEWKKERLILLPVKELASLCQLVGISHTGTKQDLVERLVDKTQLQRCIRHYWTTLDEDVTTSQIHLLANVYPGRELKAMCRRAGCYAGSTKYAMAGSLIKWDRACIRQGRESYRQARKIALAEPARQLILNI